MDKTAFYPEPFYHQRQTMQLVQNQICAYVNRSYRSSLVAKMV